MEKKTSYSTKFIEISLKFIEISLNKTQIKKFYRDRYNINFIKNEVIAVNKFRYQSYKEGWVIVVERLQKGKDVARNININYLFRGERCI